MDDRLIRSKLSVINLGEGCGEDVLVGQKHKTYICRSIVSICISIAALVGLSDQFYRELGKFEGDYTVANNEVTITKVKFLADWYIPEKINGLPVTRLGEKACYNLAGDSASFWIPEFLKYIGDSAFGACLDIKEVHVGNKDFDFSTRIFWDPDDDKDAGVNCVWINDGIESTGAMFYGCRLSRIHLYHPEVPLSVLVPYCYRQIVECRVHEGLIRAIPEGMFKGCQSLTTLDDDLLLSVSAIGKEAFRGCIAFSSFSLVNSRLKTLQDYTFAECSGLKSVDLPNELESLGEGVFSGCSKLAAVGLPSLLTNVGKRAFESCAALTEIILPDGVTQIGEAAFSNCCSLTSITIPSSVESIGKRAFMKCSSLKVVHVSKGGDVESVRQKLQQSGIDVSSLKFDCIYEITFDPRGGSCSTNSRRYSGGDPLGALPNAMRAGYSFLGWFMSDGQTRATESTVVTSDATCYAKWSANAYTVRFSANGGEGTMSNLNCIYDVRQILPSCSFNRTGYSFVGWSMTEDGAVAYTDEAEILNLDTFGEVSLYAIWRPCVYNLEFDFTGGSVNDRQSLTLTNVSHEDVRMLPRPVLSGYVFMGWALSKGGEIVIPSDGNVHSLTVSDGDTVVLYAVWERERVRVVSFKQRSSWNGLIDMSCEVFASSAQNHHLVIEAQDVTTGDRFEVKTWGEVTDSQLPGKQMLPNGYHSIVWNALSDLPQDYRGTLKLAIVGLTVPATYVVVDLAGGVGAEKFQVSTLSGAPKDGWADEYKSNKIVLRRIEPSTFTMGGIFSDDSWDYDQVEREVRITEPYYIGVFEVTKEQWYRIVGGSEVASGEGTFPVDYVSYSTIRGADDGQGWPSSRIVERGSFIDILRQKSGLVALDLPTEAQWECASRAGGVDPVDIVAYANCKDSGNNKTLVVGSLKPNDFGLYDMIGNVWEWCLDWRGSWDENAVVDPVGAENIDSAYHGDRVQKGGSFKSDMKDCHSGRHSGYGPGSERVGFGFRIALTCDDYDPVEACYSDVSEVEWSGEGLVVVSQTRKECTVEFDSNGGEGVMVPQVFNEDGEWVLKRNVFVRSGYVFMGWSKDKDADSALIEDGAVINNLFAESEATIVLYAVWEVEKVADPLIFPVDGTIITAETCTVTITTTTKGANIYFSTNGLVPEMVGACHYVGPFVISKTTKVNAIAVLGKKGSSLVSATIMMEAPVHYVDAVVGKDVTGRDEPVTVPATWVTEFLVGRYGEGKVEAFCQKFGSDLAVALAKPTGKIGPNGEIRIVWDDYVAGTDPTDIKSVFRAILIIADGKICISWDPNLNDGTDSRIYAIYGKTFIESGDWERPIMPWHKFFKVAVSLPTGESDEVSETAGEGFVPSEKDKLGGVQLWKNGPYWAECNLGASKPEDFGYYFWWGDTVGYERIEGSWNAIDGSQDDYSLSTGICPTYNKDKSQLLSDGYIDSTGNLIDKYDAATACLRSPWRMPTKEDFSALISNCTVSWTSYNNVPGYLVTGKGAYASKSIFLPAAGYGYNKNFELAGAYGLYWSSMPYSEGPGLAWNLDFNSSGFGLNCTNRSDARSVRPVRDGSK